MQSSCFCPTLRLLPPSLSMASRPPCSHSMVLGVWVAEGDQNALCFLVGLPQMGYTETEESSAEHCQP